ncbi:VOC family protein [Deinococcus navajonensis]|uniref:VOC family protein n=1 Tax=Deinococcus navajonensis TaxID=309884 RepID=A0ABV8XSW3_9DEIO
MLKHVSFLTRDLKAAVTFYERLGAVTEKHLTTAEGFGRAVLRLGTGRLQLFEVTGEVPLPHPHWAEHVAVYVSGLRTLLPQLRESGIQVTREVQPSPGGRDMAFVLDPDGRQVELLEADAG